MNKVALFLFAFLFATMVQADEQSDTPENKIAEGKLIYDMYCASACHQAPAADRLKPKQWRIVLNTMQKRMQTFGMPPLTDTELENVYAYLTQPTNDNNEDP